MTTSTSTRDPDTSLARNALNIAHHYLGGRRGIIVLAAVVVVASLAFNWSWLVAIGVVPVLLTALPCLAMCALGLCMNRMGGRSCASGAAAPPTTSQRSEPTSQQEGRSTDA